MVLGRGVLLAQTKCGDFHRVSSNNRRLRTNVLRQGGTLGMVKLILTVGGMLRLGRHYGINGLSCPMGYPR